MKVKELKKWLELYDENLEFFVDNCSGLFSPNILKRSGEMLVFSEEFGLNESDVATQNITNAVIAGKEIKVGDKVNNVN